MHLNLQAAVEAGPQQMLEYSLRAWQLRVVQMSSQHSFGLTCYLLSGSKWSQIPDLMIRSNYQNNSIIPGISWCCSS